MDVRNCVKCGRLFQYVSGPPICSKCKEKEEEDFKLIKDYIYENPNSNMMEISNATQVSSRLIERFIKEGRLILSEDSPLFIKCEKCGKEIKTGRLCSDCSRSLSNEMRMNSQANTVEKEPEPNKEKNKMHFLNKNKL